MTTSAVRHGGADVHPLLTLAAAHQEASDGLTGEESVSLGDLEGDRKGEEPQLSVTH